VRVYPGRAGPPGYVDQRLPDRSGVVAQLGGHLRHRLPGASRSPTRRRGHETTSGSATTGVDKSGKITLRYEGQLYSIGVGRTHARTHVLVLVQDRDIRIVNAATGELIREPTLDPNQRYQPTGQPRRPPRK
jgi:hypothetical protein